jgi:hypothetical protein
MIAALLIVAVYCLIGYGLYRVEKKKNPEAFVDEGDDPSDDPQDSSFDWLFGCFWPLFLWFIALDWARKAWRKIK